MAIQNNNKDIIVTLVEYKNNGNGDYSEAFVDFRTTDDYDEFVRAMGVVKNNNASVVQFLNLYSRRRLVHGAYYKLNVEILKGIEPEAIDDNVPLLVGYIFNFQNKQGNQNDLLLESHAPLAPADIIITNDGIDALTDFPEEQFKLRVNDVGQGNCNEIIDEDDNVKLVYDMGGSLHANRQAVQKLLDKRLPFYKKSHLVLFISHWDFDHIVQLKLLSDADIKDFAGLICPAKMTSMTSQNIYKRFLSILSKNKVLSLAPPRKVQRKGHSRMLFYKKTNVYSIYHGETNRNLNYCGIVLMVYGKAGNVLLTGDCSYLQASTVLSQEVDNIANCPNQIMVAPHHGGKFSRNLGTLTIPPHGYKPMSALVSVDANDNTYGHPDSDVLSDLSKIYKEVKRTDKNGTIERAL